MRRAWWNLALLSFWHLLFRFLRHHGLFFLVPLFQFYRFFSIRNFELRFLLLQNLRFLRLKLLLCVSRNRCLQDLVNWIRSKYRKQINREKRLVSYRGHSLPINACTQFRCMLDDRTLKLRHHSNA